MGGLSPSWSVSHALCSSVRSEMAGTREKLICVISFSERYGSERPCSLFVLFDFANLCSLKQNSQTGSILDQWPAPIWPFVCEMITLSFVYHVICKWERELLRARNANKKSVRDEKLSIRFYTLKQQQQQLISLPESTCSDFWHSLQKDKRHCSYFPLMAEFTLRL